MNLFLPTVSTNTIFFGIALALFLLDLIVVLKNMTSLGTYLKMKSLSNYRHNIDFLLSLIAVEMKSLGHIIRMLDEFQIPEALRKEVVAYINDAIFFHSKREEFTRMYPFLSSLICSDNIFFRVPSKILDDMYLSKKKELIEKQRISLDELDEMLSIYFFFLFLFPLVMYQIALLTGRYFWLLIPTIFYLLVSIHQRKKLFAEKDYESSN